MKASPWRLYVNNSKAIRLIHDGLIYLNIRAYRGIFPVGGIRPSTMLDIGVQPNMESSRQDEATLD